MTNVKSTVVLTSELSALKTEIAELKGQFTSFQQNFIRSDIYALRHDELVNRVAKMERRYNLAPFIWSTLGGIMVFLANYAITHH